MTKFKLPARREEVEEFFNFMDRDYDGNLSFEVFCSFTFRSARTSCTTFGWSVPSVRPVRKKNLDHLYTGIYAL